MAYMYMEQIMIDIKSTTSVTLGELLEFPMETIGTAVENRKAVVVRSVWDYTCCLLILYINIKILIKLLKLCALNPLTNSPDRQHFICIVTVIVGVSKHDRCDFTEKDFKKLLPNFSKLPSTYISLYFPLSTYSIMTLVESDCMWSPLSWCYTWGGLGNSDSTDPEGDLGEFQEVASPRAREFSEKQFLQLSFLVTYLFYYTFFLN